MSRLDNLNVSQALHLVSKAPAATVVKYVKQERLLLVLGCILKNLGERLLSHPMERPDLDIDSTTRRLGDVNLRHVISQLRAVVIDHFNELGAPHKNLVRNTCWQERKVLGDALAVRSCNDRLQHELLLKDCQVIDEPHGQEPWVKLA